MDTAKLVSAFKAYSYFYARHRIAGMDKDLAVYHAKDETCACFTFSNEEFGSFLDITRSFTRWLPE